MAGVVNIETIAEHAEVSQGFVCIISFTCRGLDSIHFVLTGSRIKRISGILIPYNRAVEDQRLHIGSNTYGAGIFCVLVGSIDVALSDTLSLYITTAGYGCYCGIAGCPRDYCSCIFRSNFGSQTDRRLVGVENYLFRIYGNGNIRCRTLRIVATTILFASSKAYSTCNQCKCKKFLFHNLKNFS